MTYWQGLKERWSKLPAEDRDYFLKAFTMIPAQFIAYKFYRKLGAPKWAAWGFTTIASNVSLDRRAYEQRQRKQKAEIEQIGEDIVSAVSNYRKSRASQN